jgi:uncharacterized protein (TIGR03437 family)
MSLPNRGLSLVQLFNLLTRKRRTQLFVLLFVATLWLSARPFHGAAASATSIQAYAQQYVAAATAGTAAPRDFWESLNQFKTSLVKTLTPARAAASPMQTTLPLVAVSAATFEGGTLAPNSIASLFGANLATRVETTTATPLPTSLAGTTVRVRDSQNVERFAQLFFVAPTQINFLIPGDTATGEATITVITGEGVTSLGRVQIARVTPGLFTANSSGRGLPSAIVLRVAADGTQTTERLAQFDPAQNRFVPEPINLRTESEQIFLIMFGTGIRGRLSVNDVSARLGGLEGGVNVPVIFAQAQGSLAGLDQINIGPINRGEVRTRLAGRGLINLTLGVIDPSNNAQKVTNVTEVELAGLQLDTPPSVGEPTQLTFLAGQNVVITGGPFQAGNLIDNRVRVGSQLTQVISATSDRLTIQLPFGVQTGKISVSTPNGEATSNNSLQVGTSISGIVETTDRQPLGGVIVRVSVTGEQTTTNPDGSFVLPINLTAPPNIFFTTLQFLPQGLSGFATYGSVYQRVEVATKRDNRLPAPVSLNAPAGRSSAVGGEINLTIPVFDCGASASATPSNVTFKLEAGATAQFPADAITTLLTLSQIKNCRTPRPLPLNVYSSRLVQLTPLGTKLNPGGQLIFPNPENLAAGTQLVLYRLDQRSESATLGQFIEAGNALVSADRLRIETGARAITEGGIYFVALPPTSVTTLTGRVVERITDNVNVPVPGAMVQVRGQAIYTDGDGAFVLRNVPINASNDSLTVQASLLRPDGRADSVLRTLGSGLLKPGGVTAIAPDLLLASLSTSSNRAPVATSQTVTLDEDTSKVIYLNATDADGNPIYYLISPPANGTLAGSAPNLIYTPNPNYNGSDNFTFKVNDGKADSNTAVVAITVNAVNDAPVLTVPGPQTVTKNQNISFMVSATDVDAGQTVTISAPTRPSGSSFIESERRFTWTPSCTQTGVFTVVFTAVDNGSPVPLSEVKTVQITVLDDNCAPSLVLPGPQTVNEGQTLNFTVSAVDPENQAYTLSAANLPSGSSFNATTGQFIWTPTCTQSGGYSVSFTAADNGTPPRSETRTLAINVNNVSVPPTISAPQEVYNISEGQEAVFTITTLQGCSNQTLSINSGNLPSGAILGDPVQNGPRVMREFRWTPSFVQAGTYNVTFTASDMTDPNAIASRVITINVVDFNLDPELSVPTTRTVNVGQQLSFNISATDADAGQIVTLTAQNLPQNATFNTTPGNPATGAVLFTPNFAQLNNFTVTFTATDSGQPARIVNKQVIIIVTGECDPILTVPGTQNAVEGVPLSFTVLGAPKCPGQSVTLSATMLPPRATFDQATGVFNWTPNIGEAATYTVTFFASDNSSPARVTSRMVQIAVTANRAPIALNQTVTLDEDTTKAISLTASDPENMPLSFTVLQPPQKGTLTGTPPNLTYNPLANYNGSDSFTFKANDGTLDSTPATVTLIINPVNDAPTVQSQAIAISEDSPANITLSGADVDGDTLSFTITKQPTNGTLTGTIPNLIYTPNANFFGTDELRYRASDGKTTSNEGVISITITSVNDVPVITVPGPQTVITGQSVSFAVTAADVDANQSLTLTTTNLPPGATFQQTNSSSTAAAGQFNWTPTEGQTGSFTVTFTVTDNGLPVLSANKTVTIVVNALTTSIAIDAPAERTINENEAVSFTVTATGGTQNQPFALNATGLPAGASFPAITGNNNSISQTFSWTPTFTQAGTYDITFTATRGVTGSKVVRINVVNVCRPPVLTVPTTTVTGSEGQALTFNVSAVDPDTGETLTLTATNLPVGATFPVATSTNGTVQQAFNWTPEFNQAGNYTATFSVTDNCSPTQRNDVKNVTISIADVNRAPFADPKTGNNRFVTAENTPIAVLLTGSDPDADTITYAIVTQPLHGTLTGTPPTMTYTPSSGYNGTDSFTFKTNDGKLDSAPGTIEIAVTAVCSAPVLTVPAAQTIALNIPQDCNQQPVATPLTFNVTATDADSADLVTLTAQNLPPGATFIQSNNTAAAASGTFSWTPNVFADARTFTVTFSAADNCTVGQTATKTVNITLNIPSAPARWQATNISKAGTLITLLNNGNNLYAGMAGGGFFLSTNNGETWPRVDQNGLTSTDIRALVAKNVGNSTTLFAATLGGGVYRSTDNGVNWTPVNNGISTSFVRALALADDGTVFAGTQGGGVFFTLNDGTTWSQVNSGLGDLNTSALTIAGSGATARIFAGTESGAVFSLFVNTLSGASPTWSSIGAGLPSSRIQTLEVNAAGDTLFAGFNNNGVYRTNITGSPNWEAVSIGLDNTTINDLLRIGTTLFAATDAGVFRFDNQTSIWAALNECLPFIRITSLATSGSATKLFAATEDGRVYIRPL